MRKYSEKFLNNYDVLVKSILGFEFEFYMKDMSFYKTLELMNQQFAPIKIHGFRQYHSDFTPTNKEWKIEPDLSGGSNMVELVTGPMEYQEAKFYLIKILKFINENGYTTEKSSIHFNLSFSDKNLNDLNILKLILNTNEEEIYRFFPSRKGNIYAKTVKKMIPYKEYDFFNIPITLVKNNMRLPDDKYFGINFLHINNDKKTQRLEYRYIGGKDYEKNIGMLTYFMDKFILDVHGSIDQNFTEADCDMLEVFLDKNISHFKNFSKYDNFIIEYPTVHLQVDMNSTYEIVSSYYPKVYDRIYDLIESCSDLKDCIINFDTAMQRVEIVDAQIRATQNLADYELINCNILEGIFDKCAFNGCEINNAQLSKSKIDNCEVKRSKVLSCRVEASTLHDCYFMNGTLNGDMIGGIWRSGELGPYASISSETKIVSDSDNFFDTSFEEEGGKGFVDKGKIEGFKK